jgi:hypothetical protein
MPLGIPGCSGQDNIKTDLKEMGARVCTGFIWFRIETGGRLM